MTYCNYTGRMHQFRMTNVLKESGMKEKIKFQVLELGHVGPGRLV